jgi:hypothetical protein
MNTLEGSDVRELTLAELESVCGGMEARWYFTPTTFLRIVSENGSSHVDYCDDNAGYCLDAGRAL